MEEAAKNAGFNPQEKRNIIEHASRDAIQMAQERDQVKSKQIRDVILNDLEHNDHRVAKAWRIYERYHDIDY